VRATCGVCAQHGCIDCHCKSKAPPTQEQFHNES
jgi:hypothetical protein